MKVASCEGSAGPQAITVAKRAEHDHVGVPRRVQPKRVGEIGFEPGNCNRYSSHRRGTSAVQIESGQVVLSGIAQKMPDIGSGIFCAHGDNWPP